jgi:hypothetical protein
MLNVLIDIKANCKLANVRSGIVNAAQPSMQNKYMPLNGVGDGSTFEPSGVERNDTPYYKPN